MYGYGGPVKGTVGGGTLAVTGAATGSWFLAGFGLLLLGAVIVFLSIRVRRS